MRFSFDYYHNLEKTDLYLCNPDGKELYPLPGRDRRVALRFNDISELTFVVDDKYTDRGGNDRPLEAYDYVRTKRLIYVTNIGWFRIAKVDEKDDGVTKQKNVTAESLQAVFRDKGFISEERVYCFYNSNDPYDDKYDSSNDGDIPSVVGQWSRQLGIKIDLYDEPKEPEIAYDDWTLVYVSDAVKDLHRSFKDNTTYGYDFIVNDVEDAFKVVVIFDILFKAIYVKTIEEVTSDHAEVIYTFHNFMKSVDVIENAEDIVTVLNCNGNNCDITLVNPTGTNYICDFSYYMDEEGYKWMSKELIEKLKAWKQDCEASQEEYISHINTYRDKLQLKLDYERRLEYESTYLTELKNAHDNRSVLGDPDDEGTLCGIVRAERVHVGEYSLDVDSSSRFYGTELITAYASEPFCVESPAGSGTYKWILSGSSKRGTADEIVAGNMSDSGSQYWYFQDNSNSYCKLVSKATVNTENKDTEYSCSGYDRYIAMRYPKVNVEVTTDASGAKSEVKKTSFVDSIQTWIDIHEGEVSDLNYSISVKASEMDSAIAQANAISDRINILSYFSNTPSLLRELHSYWIEGTYNDENIAVLENTTPAEEVDLAMSLMEAGKVELAKVSQPRFSFSLEAIDATKNYEFVEQMSELELGKIITIEKDEGLWYYPALLSLTMNLDDVDDFSMEFANALRLDDWGYTYADLIKSSASTSRQVNANWKEIMQYSKDREKIQSIIKDPLDLTLRAAYANMTNQEFSINTAGILGRKRVAEGSSEFEPEQVRLINNVLLFTDDNWKTLKTALGKIYLPDPDDASKTICKYGLAAEVLVGELFLGNELQIHNRDSSITLDEKGIAIRKVPSSGNDEEDIIFQVDIAGNLILKGYATKNELGIGLASLQSQVNNNQAVISALTTWKSSASTSIANLQIISNDHESRINNLASFDTNTTKALTSITQRVSANEASITNLASFDTEISSSVSKIEQKADDNSASISELTAWKKNNAEAIAETIQYVDSNKAEINSTVTWKKDNEESIATTIQLASQHETRLANIATWQNQTTSNIAAVNQLANANGASIGLVVKNGEVQGGVLISAINGETSAKISADRLDIMGKTLNIKVAATNITGKLTATQIEAGAITVDTISVDKITGGINTNQICMTNFTALGGAIAGWTISNGDLYCNSAYDFFTSVDNLYTGAYGCGIRLSTNSGLGEGAIGGISIGCCPVPASEAYDATYHQQFIFGSKHMFRSRWSATCYGLNIEARGIYFSAAYDDIGVTGVAFTNYIGNSPTGVTLHGNWQASSCLGTGSARVLKNGISALDDRHSVLFDGLIPRAFKYNDGSSNRTHFGLIVDELGEAMTLAGLDSSECAAYCLEDVNDPHGVGAIRYSELIPLCIREIQLLKQKVKDLMVALGGGV